MWSHVPNTSTEDCYVFNESSSSKKSTNAAALQFVKGDMNTLIVHRITDRATWRQARDDLHFPQKCVFPGARDLDKNSLELTDNSATVVFDGVQRDASGVFLRALRCVYRLDVEYEVDADPLHNRDVQPDGHDVKSGQQSQGTQQRTVSESPIQPGETQVLRAESERPYSEKPMYKVNVPKSLVKRFPFQAWMRLYADGSSTSSWGTITSSGSTCTSGGGTCTSRGGTCTSGGTPYLSMEKEKKILSQRNNNIFFFAVRTAFITSCSYHKAARITKLLVSQSCCLACPYTSAYLGLRAEAPNPAPYF